MSPNSRVGARVVRALSTLFVGLAALGGLRLSAEDLAAEKATTKQRMLKVYEAIQNYRKDFKELPPSLGVLYPKYIPDLETFLSPTGERNNHKIPFDALVDPKIKTHFGYEFSDRPMGDIWAGKDMKIRDFKQLQMLLIGGQVPMIRCFVYGDNEVYNVTFDGTFFESPVTWETMWDDRIAPGAFNPENLLSRVAAMLPSDAGGDAIEWIRLRPRVAQQVVYEILNRGGEPSVAAAKAVELATTVEAFLEKYPQASAWNEASQLQRRLLIDSSMLGATNSSTLWTKAVERGRKRPGATETERYRLEMDHAVFGMMMERARGDEKAAGTKFVEGLRSVIRDFPDQVETYDNLLQAAEDAGLKSEEVAKEILANAKAPSKARELAQAVLDREKLLNEPLALKFTAVDGRPVDFASLRGKVVLVDFWATWCGPCVAELPNVLETYRKYHDQGLEIVGISFDSDRSALEQFIAKKSVPWPQYFDGEAWGNKYGKMFGIRAIPTMWLLDHNGRIAEREARGPQLSKRVEQLLAARPKA
ncbi:MAG: TlpA family protein disulfide reductase [Verrucomicrobiales bacterium]|nr:TlpA family protein disulfide reductase [Verrucomicrobiales bacterium]